MLGPSSIILTRAIKDGGMTSCSHDGLKDPLNEYFSNISLRTICVAYAKCITSSAILEAFLRAEHSYIFVKCQNYTFALWMRLKIWKYIQLSTSAQSCSSWFLYINARLVNFKTGAMSSFQRSFMKAINSVNAIPCKCA